MFVAAQLCTRAQLMHFLCTCGWYISQGQQNLACNTLVRSEIAVLWIAVFSLYIFSLLCLFIEINYLIMRKKTLVFSYHHFSACIIFEYL